MTGSIGESPPGPVPPPAPSPADVIAADEAPLQVDDKRKKKKKDKDNGKLGSSRGIETMFRTSYRTHLDLSQMADNKANIMISINGIIISIVIASISPKIDSNPFLLMPTAALLLGCALSLVYAVLAARPRVTRQTVTLQDVLDNRANVLFFGNFVDLDVDQYLEAMKALILDTDRLYTNMMRDIYFLGLVLDRKYRLLRTAYTVFMFSTVIGVLFFVTVYVLTAGPAGFGS